MNLLLKRSIALLFSAALLMSALAAFTGCSAEPKQDNAELQIESTEKKVSEKMVAEFKGKRKIIIDTDTAGDDAAALVIAAKTKNVDILGVTVSAGNVSLDQAVDNALMTLEMAGCDAPVYRGASATYKGVERETFSVYGKDGMGDKDLIHPKRKAEDTAAVDFIIDAIKANPDKVEIIALGPVTNLALAFDKDPETMKQVKKYWSMGTSGFGVGNASPVAEFNVYHDAEAYKVFAESGVPVTAVGLDMLPEETRFSKADFDAIEKKGGLSEFTAKSFSGLLKFYEENRGLKSVEIPDAVAMACALWDGYLQETKACHATVMTEDNEAYGMVILYQKGFGYDSGVTFDDYNFNVVTKTASDTFKDTFIRILEK